MIALKNNGVLMSLLEYCPHSKSLRQLDFLKFRLKSLVDRGIYCIFAA